jgi:hypothetical protein
MTTMRIVLIVQDSSNSIELLKFIERNIRRINAAGMILDIKKIEDFNEDALRSLKSRGITRLPALITQHKNYIGRREIEQALRKLCAPPSDHSDYDNDLDLHGYFMKHIGCPKDPSKASTTDEDSFGDASKEIQERLAAYMKNIPSHRRGVNSGPEIVANQPQATQEHHPAPQHQPRNNIAQEDMSAYINHAPGDADSMMISAWLQNNVQ